MRIETFSSGRGLPNQKGFLFTFMALVLILSIMALNSSIQDSKNDSQKFLELARLVSVNNKFSNIERSAIDFKKSGIVNEFNQRIMPFTYNIDSNSISVLQNLPLASGEANSFFDFMNLFGVFLEDSSYGNVFDGLNVDVNTVQNPFWGGSAEKIQFLIEPFCYQFSLNDLNGSSFGESKSGKCAENFDLQKIRRFDSNIVVRNFSEDFNRILCNGGACPDNPFDPSNPQPYYKIAIDDSNCGNCYFPQKIIANHFDPNTDTNISILCQGISCRSKSIDFVLNKGFSVSRNSDSNYSVQLGMAVSFDSNIEQFYFLDFNYSVRDSDFNILKTNNPQAIS